MAETAQTKGQLSGRAVGGRPTLDRGFRAEAQNGN